MDLPFFISLLLSLLLIVIGLFFGGLTFYFFYKNFQNWQAARQSQFWPTVPGTIEKAEIIWVGVRSKSPKPVITYTYHVNGVSYTGSRIAFEFAHVYTREETDALLRRYPAGAEIPIYYDPARPAESTLETQSRGLGTGLLVTLVLLFSPTAFCLCVGIVGLMEQFK